VFSKNDKISTRQVEILLVLDMFSTGVLTLPRNVAEIGKQDGWMIVILATLLAIFYGYLITKLAKMFPQDTFVEFSGKIISKPIGIFLSFVLLIKIMITTAFEVRIFGELVKQTLLPKTPIEVIIISMLLVAAYLVRKGLECRARIAEILVFIVLVPIILIFTFVLFEADFTNLQPMFVTPVSQLLKGAYSISLTYVPLEFLLISCSIMRRPQQATKAVGVSVIVVGFIKLFVVIVVFSVFGQLETKHQIWPVMTLMQVIELPGSFIERQDALMMIFWIISVFAVINAGFYFISMIFTKVIQAEEQNFLVLPFLPIVYIISLLPDNVVQTYDWLDILFQYFGILFLLPVPIILLVIAKIRKLGDTVANQ
jgi:spore germination protein